MYKLDVRPYLFRPRPDSWPEYMVDEYRRLNSLVKVHSVINGHYKEYWIEFETEIEAVEFKLKYL